MISINAKKHDNFSVEFKFGFNCVEDGVPDDFSVNAWMFVPNSLDINSENYGKKQFYRDIKSNVRLITPVYLLRDIVQDGSQPLNLLRSALEKVVENPVQEQDTYEYHLKMFAAIFKSALRDQVQHMQDAGSLDSAEYLVEDYISNAGLVMKKFRELYRIIDVPTVPEKTRSLFKLCDEFMSHVLELRTIRLIRNVDSYPESQTRTHIRERFTQFLVNEYAYKKSKGYGVMNGDPKHDRELVYHRGMLKKFIESELYIRLDKKKDGVAIEQIYYSIAAGAAMIFATAVAWITQVKYGNITWPLFLVLVVSYMLKDRIKDLLRYYFAHKLGNKYYDNKASITIGKNRVGEIKEGFDFISKSRAPEYVRKLREEASAVEDESRIFEEKVLLYRKRVSIDDAALAGNVGYPMRGINEIMRLHLHRFTHKMDNPMVPIDSIDEEGRITSKNVEKIYYIHIVFQLSHDGEKEYRHFCISMTRDGVLDIVNHK
ncbi:MAG: hypothetical protein IKW55_05585 [Bacteroidales bacterium]|nr:hypothetical protein [Bacteroidales bacterium]